MLEFPVSMPSWSGGPIVMDVDFEGCKDAMLDQEFNTLPLGREINPPMTWIRGYFAMVG